MKISILGDGAWGTAFANLLADNNHDVLLWCFNSQVYADINSKHENSIFLPGVKLNKNIKATQDLNTAVNHVDLIIEAIPVKFLRQVLLKVKTNVDINKPWLVLSKGIENDSLLFPAQIIQDVLGQVKFAILSGPSFAQDLASQQITSVNLASQNLNLLNNLKQVLDNKYFFTKFTNDIIGVQVCGALKNIIALALGILDGARYGDNTKAFIFTKGLEEIVLINKALSGKIETVYDLAGVGDLVLTAYSNKSKNFELGQKIGQAIIKNSNSYLTELLKSPVLPEGINTLKSVMQLKDKLNLELILITGVYDIIYANKNLSHVFCAPKFK